MPSSTLSRAATSSRREDRGRLTVTALMDF
jgi:hypothetical protein